MRTRVLGWRWRRSPLRRRSDVVEAWTVLVVAVLLSVGAPLVGAFAAWWAYDEARAAMVRQRAERHQVRAEVLGPSPRAPSPARVGGQHAYRATVRWTEWGEGPRTSDAYVPVDARPGDAVEVWFDARERSVPPPVDSESVRQHSLGVGACAAGCAAGAVLLAHGVVRQAALRRRLAEWEREWARTEPRWSHRGV
ncbi:hypothetical protein ACFYOV_26335 [Streptomyces sp. NPDC005931]|uniref:Rv1733c family protein n=1 Tax=Streptomyces sp. NPDC005931 TaxID=3364737 RepID=UPI0036941F13